MRALLIIVTALLFSAETQASPSTSTQLPPVPSDLTSTIVETKLIINFEIQTEAEKANPKPKQTEFFQPIHIKKIEKVTKTT